MTEQTDGVAGSETPELAAEKVALRKAMALRRSAVAMETMDATARLTANLTAALAPGAGTVVSGYWPMRDEIDPRATLSALSTRGCRTALPVMVGPHRPLVFRSWEWGDPLVKVEFGVSEPAHDAEEVQPSILLVPMLAFDRTGQRLGYGGGFYDRTLAGLRRRHAVRAIGIAFAAQEVDAVPTGPYDVALDGICTEREFIEIERS
jgi:5-formyltetrahydrofolate cyclo-ligase